MCKPTTPTIGGITFDPYNATLEELAQWCEFFDDPRHAVLLTNLRNKRENDPVWAETLLVFAQQVRHDYAMLYRKGSIKGGLAYSIARAFHMRALKIANKNGVANWSGDSTGV